MFARRVLGCGELLCLDSMQLASAAGMVVCVNLRFLFCFYLFFIAFVGKVVGHVARFSCGFNCFDVGPYDVVQSWCFRSFGFAGAVFVLW